MKTNAEKDEKKCLACKRIIIGDSKFGICPDCLNKYGTPIAAIGIGGLAFLGNEARQKYGRKLIKGAFDVIKHIK